jgi:DNA-binding NtrC family response regulator
VKLLRVLDSVAYYRLGGVKKVSVDVRVVAATNQNLEAAVAAGKFRGDLYHRLAQLTLKVPPLRQRVEDIAPLARHFLAQHDPELRFSPQAIGMLERQSWPGNIRELRNIVTKAAVLARDLEISASELECGGSSEGPVDAHNQNATALNPAPPAHNLEEMEKRAILDAMAATDGHQQNAAARLGISRRTLNRKLKLYGPEGAMARA